MEYIQKAILDNLSTETGTLNTALLNCHGQQLESYHLMLGDVFFPKCLEVLEFDTELYKCKKMTRNLKSLY